MGRNRVKEARIRAGISQEELAAQMPEGMNNVAVGFIEKNRVMPTREGMAAMCAIFKCEPITLFDEADLDLSLKRPKSEVRPEAIPNKTGTAPRRIVCARWGNGELRARVKDELRERFLSELADFGYRDFGDWLHEQIRRVHASHLRAYGNAQGRDKDKDQ